MNLLLEPDDIDDAHSLAQVYAAKMVITKDVKRLVSACCRHVRLPVEVGLDGQPLPTKTFTDDCHPTVSGEQTSLKVQTCLPCHSKPTLAHHNEPIVTTPTPGQCENIRNIVDILQVDVPNRADPAVTIKMDTTVKHPTCQSSLHRFFSKKPVVPERFKKTSIGLGQTKISDFFSTKKAETIAPDLAWTIQSPQRNCLPENVPPTNADPNALKEARPGDSPVEHRLAAPTQHKCSEHQETAPPVFETDQPRPQPQNPPPRPQRPVWRMHLANIFDEMAVVRQPGAGPVMQVEVWYVHHETFPECHASRVVELDDFQDLWYADICNVWMDRIQRHQPLRVLNVLPNPPFHTRARTEVHLILEQGLHPEKVAIHFTTLFLGGDRIGLFQRALSAPTRICTRDMIVRHGFQLQCDYRNCHMHSGRLRFSMYDPEEIFSGISAVLSVAPPPPEPMATHPPTHEHHDPPPVTQPDPSAPPGSPDEEDRTSMMQRTAFEAHANAPPRQDQPNETPLFDHRMTPAAISDFRATLAWQSQRSGPSCSIGCAPFSVHTWYLHSDRRIRTEDFRTVLLHPHPHAWHRDIISRWQDMLDPAYPVNLHVVIPDAPDINLQPAVHVIIVQKPNPLWRATLLVTEFPIEAAWDVTLVCAMLDTQTDLEQIGFISGIHHPSNQQAHLYRIEVSHGESVLPPGGTFPVRDGYSFMIRAYRTDTPPTDEVAALQLQLGQVRKSIQTLQKVVYRACAGEDSPGTGDAAHQPSEAPLSVAVLPNEPHTFLVPADALSFFTHLQALWQPLALLHPPHMPALVPVVTWYIDHIRFPQCFQPRYVLLNADPNDWIQRIRSAWMDLVLPQNIMHIHIVQPAVLDMPTHLAAHLIIVQQPVADFKSILISSIDSDMPGVPATSHASLSPTPVAYNTVLALAYYDTVCQQQQNECAAWVGHTELTPEFPLPLIDGHAVVVALHRHPVPIQDRDTAWDASEPYAAPGFPQMPVLPQPNYTGPMLSPIISTVPAPCPGFPVVLSLDAALPFRRATPHLPWQEDLSTIEWSVSPHWHKVVATDLCLQLSPVPSNMTCTDATWTAIFEAMASEIGPYELVELYIDGATNSIAASWSMIVVVHSGGSPRLLGTLAGPVVINSHLQEWIGATTLDNIAAELSALAAALSATIQFSFPCPVHIRPDLSLSRLIAQELVTTVSNTNLAKVCRLLAAWVPRTTEVHEVRGHTHDAWNDLADSLAKQVLIEPDSFPPVHFGRLHDLVSDQHNLDWAWLQTKPDTFQHCFPNIVDRVVWQFQPSNRSIAMLEPNTTPQLCPVAFQCKMATINVLALDRTDSSAEIGRRKGARTSRLDHQLNAAGLHIVGLQETRTSEGVYRTDHYKILASGGDGPNAMRSGCELWLHRTQPVMTTGNSQKIILADCHCTVVHADPRRLFVKLQHTGFSITAVVLHAPCLGKANGDAIAPIDIIRTWWTDTAAIWERAVQTQFTCVFVDANATLATACTEFFQMHQADSTTAQSQIFESFLLDHSMYVPATFPALHTGPSYTWTHSSGRRMRLDYVLLSWPLFHMVAKSHTWTDYDGTFSHEDHIPAVIHLEGWLADSAPSPKHQWDDLALLDPIRCKAFQAALNTLPLPTWEVNVESHSQLYEHQYLQLAKQFFTKKKGCRRRPTLCSHTLDAIAFKRHVLDCGRAWGLMTDPHFKEQLKAIEREVRRRVSSDLQVFFDQMLVQLQEAGQLSDHKQMFRILARLGSRRHRIRSVAKPLPLLRAPNGEAAQSFEQQQQLWADQFARIEAGLFTSWKDHLSLDNDGPDLPKDIQQPETFPTDWEVQAAVSALKRGKAPGPNGITPCLLKAGGSTFSKHFLAITTKVVAHAKEPTRWKGGRLVPLYKGKDSTTDPSAYRAIYISDYTSKLYHRALRCRLEPPWTAAMDLLQFGGRKNMGTDLAHHMLEAHHFWCRSTKTPSAIVFFDLKAAFYSVLRQALVPGLFHPEHVAKALRSWGIPTQLIDLWMSQASSDHALMQASPHVECLIQDCMHNTFFTMEGVEGLCHTTRGTRPGDPLGDLLFNLIMRLVLRDMHQTIQNTGAAAWLGAANSCETFGSSRQLPPTAYFDVSFVDDAAIAIHAPTLAEVENIIQVVVQAFHNAAKTRGLDVNFSQGKTEVLWDIIGKGSRALKERLHDQGHWLKWERDGQAYCLRMAHTYKHLGSWLQVGGSHQREISHRAGQALQSWGCLARSFYHKRYVGMKAKTIAFQSLSMSRMMYNAHTWTGITDEQVAQWQQKLRKPVGLLTKPQLRGIAPVKVDTVDLFALSGVLPPMDQLHLARLRYLKRLLAYCPQTLWDLLLAAKDVPNSWLDSCAQSFAWFVKFYQVPGAPVDTHDLTAWLTHIALDPNWKGRLKSAAKGCLKFRQATAEHNVWNKAFHATFQAGGGTIPCPQQIHQNTWVCDLCNRAFPSKRALATHSGRAHGYRRMVKFYAVGEMCGACVKLYATRKRLIEHLRDATSCLQTLQACFPPLSDQQVLEMDTEDHATTLQLRAQGWGAAKALAPMRKMQGPGLPSAGTADAATMLAKWCARQPTVGSGFQNLQGHSVTRQDNDQPQVRLFAQDLPAFVFQSEAGMQRGDGRYSQTGLARETARLHIRTLVFVHFFSGYRRKGDLHDILQHHVFPQGHQLFILSVDMCLQRERGDLATSTSLTWWLDKIRSGHVCGAGGGPPCETFSAARMLSGGPPPVRSGAWPNGIPSIALRAWRQVMIGSRLMQFMLDVFFWHWRCAAGAPSSNTLSTQRGQHRSTQRAYGHAKPCACCERLKRWELPASTNVYLGAV